MPQHSSIKVDIPNKPELSPGLRIVFMGTPDFAVPSLIALVKAGCPPIAVVTGADKPRGRGQKFSPTAVKKAAMDLGIEDILQPENVKDPIFATQIADLKADIIVVVAFRILPSSVFEAARLGTFNLHGSLLPRYRGAAPINRAIMGGDTQTGVTTFLLQQKVDTGNVLLKKAMSIGENETAGEVHDRMMILGAEAVVDTVKILSSGSIEATPQDNSLATPAPKIFKDDALINWSESAQHIHNQVRGMSPYPGAFTFLNGVQLKILRTSVFVREEEGDLESQVSSTKSVPNPILHSGEIVESRGTIRVVCGNGMIEIHAVQLAGKRAMPTADFLRGNPVAVSTVLGLGES